MRALALFAALALAGCAQTETAWQKAGAGDKDLAQDSDGCRARAYSGQGVMGTDPQRVGIIYESCMEAKGWRRVQAPKP